MCVISHVHCDQPPGTHRLILSLKVTQHTYNNKIFRAVMQILLYEYVCNYDYTIITKTHRIEIWALLEVEDISLPNLFVYAYFVKMWYFEISVIMSLMTDKNRREDISQGLFHLRLQSNKNNPEQCWADLHVGRVELWVVSWRIGLWKSLRISSHFSTSLCMENERLLCKTIRVVVWEIFCWRAFRNPRDMV